MSSKPDLTGHRTYHSVNEVDSTEVIEFKACDWADGGLRMTICHEGVGILDARLMPPDVRAFRDELTEWLNERSSDNLPWTAHTLADARTQLTAWHFAKESLTDREREILYVAEALLRVVDGEP